MSENKRILNEFFFKKKSYAEKMKKSLPQYEPVDVKTTGQPGFGSILDLRDNMPKTGQEFIAVTDMEEAKKRLTSSFGAAVGINTVKNIASRAIKSFPIVLSENVEPETAVMLKRLLEEQYAEYLNLLISNKVIDISAFKSTEEGNIAIQALDVALKSPEFGKQRLAKKAMTGELTDDDVFGNLSAYELIRNESKEYKTGNKLTDALLERALIVKSEDADRVVQFISEHAEEIEQLREEKFEYSPLIPHKTSDEGIDKLTKAIFGEEKMSSELDPAQSAEAKRLETKVISNPTMSNSETLIKAGEALKVSAASKPTELDPSKQQTQQDLSKVLASTEKSNPKKFRELAINTPRIVVDSSRIDSALDKTIGQILSDNENEAIRDRFEKATFLLQSNRISGSEYIEYLVQRLGIPVQTETRRELVKQFKVQNTLYPNATFYDARVSPGGKLTDEDARRISQNKVMVHRSIGNILSVKSDSALKATLALGGIAAGAALAGAGAMGATALLLTPLALGIIGGSIVGVSGAWLVKTLAKHFGKKSQLSGDPELADRIMGWERVEALIISMEESREEIIKRHKNRLRRLSGVDDEQTFNKEDLKKLIDTFKEGLKKSIEEVKPREVSSEQLAEAFAPVFDPTKKTLNEMTDFANEVIKDLESNSEYRAAVLSEAIISTTTPIDVKPVYKYDPKAKPEVMVVPKFSTRSAFAYGSVEYEKKELKDRRYNAPLLIKVTFKERFADGTFSDNELVAVLGILGVVTRVPSEEMEYILKANTEGNTLEGIFKPQGDTSNLFGNLIGTERIKKDVENLPKSGPLWQHLERIKQTTIANKLAGKESDNIANAHIVFSQKEIDNVKADTNTDYMRKTELVAELMSRYSAFSIMIANDVSQRLYIFDDPDALNWNVIPYSTMMGKDTGEQLDAVLKKMSTSLREGQDE